MGKSRELASSIGGARTARPNLIVNGDFQVWQRSNNGYTGTSGYISADRWHATRIRIRKPNTNGATGEDPRGAVFDCSDGNVYAHVDYRLENIDNELHGKTAILTFEAKSLTGSAFSLYMEQTGGDCFDRGGSGNVSIGTDWTKVTYTGTINATTGGGITVARWYLNPTGNTAYGNKIQVDNVKLEIVDDGILAPTQFVSRHKSEEMDMCQRYFQKLGGPSYTGIGTCASFDVTSRAGVIHYHKTMRALPSFSTTNDAGFIVTDRTGYDAATTGFYGVVTGLSSLNFNVNHAANGVTRYRHQLAVRNGYTTYIFLEAEI